MASFEVPVKRLEIEPHPGADRLELAAVGGYRSIVVKGQYKSGDLAAYIPEGSVCPERVIAKLGLEGKLAGSKANRVKAIRLRGALSQGLIYPLDEDGRLAGHEVAEGDDVAEILEIAKYEPPIPAGMEGQFEPATGFTISFDVENAKKFPSVLESLQGRQVSISEKLHGTWCCLGWHPGKGPIVTSKGLSAKKLIFLMGDGCAKNFYVRAWEAHRDDFAAIRARLAPEGGPVYLLGEIYGREVQDLEYGRADRALAVFDIFVGEPSSGRYLSPPEVRDALEGTALSTVPILYEGEFAVGLLDEITGGKTALGGGHIREGVVIRPMEEMIDPDLGRVILKSVSEDYLLRKGGTEYE